MKTIQSTVSTPDELYPFHQPLEQIAFFDIETTGLSPKTSSIYLIGVMHYNSHKQSWQITQWFADDYQSEEPILEAFLSYLEDFSYLYHFNGCTFDIPFVKAKCKKHHIAIPETVQPILSKTISSQVNDAGANIDLLKEIRPLKKLLGLAKANQTYLEHWIGLNREDTYDGGQLIKVYSEYMQQKIMKKPGADELEHLLLLHNHDDIAGMLSVCIMLSYKDLFYPVRPFFSCSCTAENDRIHISFPVRLPRESTLYHAFEKSDSSECIFTEPACLSLQKNLATLSLPLYRGVLKFFFPDHKDYYYLPQEDTAIHKSVAQFVDASCRRKATAANCYTKKEGIFLPSLAAKESSLDKPRFYMTYKASPACYLLSADDPDEQKEMLSSYLFHELPFF